MKAKSISYILFPVLLLVGGNALAQDTTGSALTQPEFEKMMKKKRTVVLDVRTPEEYQAGYIGNAVLYNVLDSTRFIEQISTLNKKKKYVLYCKSGRRSGKAVKMLKAQGFKKVYHFPGGVTGWKGELNRPNDIK